MPAREERYFKQHLLDDRVTFVSQESMVDPVFYPRSWYPALKRLWPNQSWRFRKFSGRPGWFVQQVAKLNATQVIDTPVIVVLDSDFVFMRYFSDDSFLGGDPSIRLLYRAEPETESGKQPKVMRRARELLALPSGREDHHYIGWPVVWYSLWLKNLTDYIEKLHDKPWQQVLFETELFSEY